MTSVATAERRGRGTSEQPQPNSTSRYTAWDVPATRNVFDILFFVFIKKVLVLFLLHHSPLCFANSVLAQGSRGRRLCCSILDWISDVGRVWFKLDRIRSLTNDIHCAFVVQIYKIRQCAFMGKCRWWGTGRYSSICTYSRTDQRETKRGSEEGRVAAVCIHLVKTTKKKKEEGRRRRKKRKEKKKEQCLLRLTDQPYPTQTIRFRQMQKGHHPPIFPYNYPCLWIFNVKKVVM